MSIKTLQKRKGAVSMRYDVKVKDSGRLAGYNHDGARLTILPKHYEVEIPKEGVLVFKNACENDESDLIVKKSEYLELADFPDIRENPYIKLTSIL